MRVDSIQPCRASQRRTRAIEPLWYSRPSKRRRIAATVRSVSQQFSPNDATSAQSCAPRRVARASIEAAATSAALSWEPGFKFPCPPTDPREIGRLHPAKGRRAGVEVACLRGSSQQTRSQGCARSRKSSVRCVPGRLGSVVYSLHQAFGCRLFWSCRAPEQGSSRGHKSEPPVKGRRASLTTSSATIPRSETESVYCSTEQ